MERRRSPLSGFEKRYERFGECAEEADALHTRLTKSSLLRQLQVTPDIVGGEVLCLAENLDRALWRLDGRGEHAAV